MIPNLKHFLLIVMTFVIFISCQQSVNNGNNQAKDITPQPIYYLENELHVNSIMYTGR